MSAGSAARPAGRRRTARPTAHRPAAHQSRRLVRVAVWVVVVLPVVVAVWLGATKPWSADTEVVRAQGHLSDIVITAGALVSLLLAVPVWVVGARRSARARQDARTAAAVDAAVGVAVREAVDRAVADAQSSWGADARAAHQTFLSRLDHELKNPVTAIRASVAAIHDSGVTGEPVDVIDTQSARIAGLVADLRKLADLETAPIEVAPVAMEPLIADVVTVVRDELAANPAGGPRSIQVQLPMVPWRVADVAGDVDLLFLAVYNVVRNAVKYSAPGASIIVRGMEDSGGILLEVADTGQGIPDDEVGSVWDELTRASNARGMPGSGLGLPLVRTIVERHRGRVQLTSRLGKGTSVRLWLPFAQPGAVAGWNTGPIPEVLPR